MNNLNYSEIIAGSIINNKKMLADLKKFKETDQCLQVVCYKKGKPDKIVEFRLKAKIHDYKKLNSTRGGKNDK